MRGLGLGWEKADMPHASKKPTIRDLEWAAGFVEGEGTFNCRGKVEVAQVNKEPLLKLQELFGGRVRTLSNRKFPCSYWSVYGSRARGVMLTLYSLLSEQRQKQVRAALGGCSN